MNPFELFERTHKTVNDFNAIFYNSKLKASETAEVEIGSIVSGNTRRVYVDGQKLFHEFVPVKVRPEKVLTKPDKEKVKKSIVGDYENNRVISKREMELTPTQYKLLQLIRGFDSVWHSTEKLREKLRTCKRTVRYTLTEMEALGIIEVERVREGTKIILKGEWK
jgi:hypothetical protein